MTTQEKKFAIAEHLGLDTKPRQMWKFCYWLKGEEQQTCSGGWPCKEGAAREIIKLEGQGFEAGPVTEDYLKDADIPNFSEDLNAMREALLTLTPKQLERFVENTAKVTGKEIGLDNEAIDVDFMDFLKAYFLARAEQLSEAFLRAVGKWKE